MYPMSKIAARTGMFGTRSKVYTRTGDKGTSSLYTGERRRKDDRVFEALGDLDELNAAVGQAREYCRIGKFQKLEQQLEMIQSRLMDVSAHVATPRIQGASEAKIQRTEVKEKWITTLEGWIDEIDTQIPPLVRFILPSGGIPATSLHLCRTICRRAERRVVGLALDADNAVDQFAIKYVNRLSDFLFTAARYVALQEGHKETLYTKEDEAKNKEQI